MREIEKPWSCTVDLDQTADLDLQYLKSYYGHINGLALEAIWSKYSVVYGTAYEEYNSRKLNTYLWLPTEQ